MRRPRQVLAQVVLALALASNGEAFSQSPPGPEPPAPFPERLRTSIERHLGKPYVWGSAGLRSFDCSGFVWRVAQESGVLFKRTTARKLYMSLPKVPQGEERGFPTVVFFDHLKHCGIMNGEKEFFHAAVTLGTHRTPMNAFWKPKICGFRRLPVPKNEPARPNPAK